MEPVLPEGGEAGGESTMGFHLYSPPALLCDLDLVPSPLWAFLSSSQKTASSPALLRSQRGNYFAKL